MAKPPANSIEGRALPYVERIERVKSEIQTIQDKAKADCKDLQETIRDIFVEVKSHGLPVRAVRGVVKYRDLERKQAAIADKLDIDEASTYQALVDALGDLGRAAAERAGVVVNLAR